MHSRPAGAPPVRSRPLPFGGGSGRAEPPAAAVEEIDPASCDLEHGPWTPGRPRRSAAEEGAAVPAGDLAAGQDAEQRAGDQPGPERHQRLAGEAQKQHGGDAGQPAKQEGGEHPHRHRPPRQPAEGQAQGGRELHVAKPHALRRDQREQQEEGADGGGREQAAAEPTKVAQSQAGRQQQAGHQREDRIGDAVGQQPGGGVDHRQHHADKGQDQVGGNRPAQALAGQPQCDQKPERAHSGLDGRVADRDAGQAAAAAPAEQQPAEHGHIVPPSDGGGAGWAARTGPDQRFAPRDAVAHHAGEGAGQQPEQPGQRRSNERGHGGSLSRVGGSRREPVNRAG
jgi:hypothetical protein